MGGKLHLVRAAVCSVFVLFAATSIGNESSGTPRRGLFVSIDGLRPDYLRIMSQSGLLRSAHGLKWLFDTSVRSEKAVPVDTTLTAPSHTSIITCSHPAQHGIFSNSFMSGTTTLNGFTADIHSETLWQAARRQGRRVISVGYVGVDGRNADRQVDWGISFPSDPLVGKTPAIIFDKNKLAPATGWKISAPIPQTSTLREAQVAIQLNAKTQEVRTVNILFQLDENGSGKVTFDDDKDLTNGILDEMPLDSSQAHFANLYFIEKDPNSPISGAKRRIFARSLPTDPEKISIYFSKTTYNNAYPPDYRKLLDDRGLVWPDEDMPTKTDDGHEITPREFVAASQLLSKTMTDIARFTMDRFPNDLVLFYQHMIDSLGHKYQAAMPEPFDPNAQDPATLAFVEAFQNIDNNLSEIFGTLSDQDVVALMGDHGMDPVISDVNIAHLVPGLDTDAQFVSAGSLMLMYTANDELGAQLAAKLKELSYQGRPVLGTAYQKSATSGDWNYGDASWAFTSGAGFILHFTPNEPNTFVKSAVGGMHGQDPSIPTMATAFLFHAAELSPEVIGLMSLIDAVPTFSKYLGLVPPKNCQGHPLR